MTFGGNDPSKYSELIEVPTNIVYDLWNVDIKSVSYDNRKIGLIQSTAAILLHTPFIILPDSIF